MIKTTLIAALLTLNGLASETAHKATAKSTHKAEIKAAPHINDTYKIDPASSQITWVGKKAIGSKHEGAIQFKEGSLEVAKDKIVGGIFTVDMKSLTNSDLKDNAEYQTKLVTHLKSEDFFNVEKFPESTLKIKSVSAAKDGEAKVTADLTFIGKTATITFPAKVSVKEGVLSADATLNIDRTKWGLKYGSGKFFKGLGDKMIKDDFDLNVKLIAKK